MITLYKFTTPARDNRVIWALHELGFDYETKILNPKAGEHLQPEFLSLNPFGKIPVITHNGKSFTESLAIIEYLNDLHADKPLTPNSDDREANYRMRQALSFGMSEIECYLWLIMKVKLRLGNEQWDDNAEASACIALNKALPIAFEWLNQRQYIAGDTFTMADIYLHQLFSWSQMVGFELPEQVKHYLDQLAQRAHFPESLKQN